MSCSALAMEVLLRRESQTGFKAVMGSEVFDSTLGCALGSFASDDGRIIDAKRL